MAEDVLILAAGIFEDGSQYRHVAEIAAVVQPLSQRDEQTTVLPRSLTVAALPRSLTVAALQINTRRGQTLSG